MKGILLSGLLLAGVLVACGPATAWPDPPPVDRSRYDAEYDAWLNERRMVAAEAVRLVGVWPLPEGETPFGSDTSLPIALPASAAPGRAGVFRRVAEKITVVPAADRLLRSEDGHPLTGPSDADGVLALGPLRLLVENVGEGFGGRRFVTAWDESRVDPENPPRIATYPLDFRWRIAARFEAFDPPRAVEVADVRGGVQYFVAAGQVTFRASGREFRLTALTVPDRDMLLMMFKDATNAATTYRGYRIVYAPSAADREWTVLDFNLASNPPCAYSPYTLCPLPPAENHLKVGIEAGEKRFPGW